MDVLVSNVAVPVTDLERSKSFYTGVLGFRLLSDREHSSGPRTTRVIRLQPPGGGAAIMLSNWFPTMAPGSLRGLAFDTADIEACRRRLQQAGASPSAIADAPWGRITIVRDPDDNHLVFQQPGAEPAVTAD